MSSATIPSLLIPEISSANRSKTPVALKLAGEETINDDAAYKIETTLADKNVVLLWIDKNNLLIVKIFEAKKFEEFETETTAFRPHANVNVAEDKPAFNAPEKAK